jgi:hypothetical protein
LVAAPGAPGKPGWTIPAPLTPQEKSGAAGRNLYKRAIRDGSKRAGSRAATDLDDIPVRPLFQSMRLVLAGRKLREKSDVDQRRAQDCAH